MAGRLIGFAAGPTTPVQVPENGRVQATVTVKNNGLTKGDIWLGGYISYGSSPETWPGRVAFKVQSGADKAAYNNQNACVVGVDPGASRQVVFLSDPIAVYQNVHQLDVYFVCGQFDPNANSWTRYDDSGVHTGAILVGNPVGFITAITYTKV